MSQLVKWDDIDKVRFFGIGTVAYSGLTVALHPMTVLKTRQQIHQTSLRATYQDIIAQGSSYRGLFRGAGIVVSLAVPARMVYISVLEVCRHESSSLMEQFLNTKQSSVNDPTQAESKWIPIVASLSGGMIAGGLAAMCAQLIAVPMDVISQKQMVMPVDVYQREGSVKAICSNILRQEGWIGLYKGFGLSIFSSLPTGSIWWATYGGSQHLMDSMMQPPEGTFMAVVNKLLIQVTSGVTAAVVASSLTQPLDAVKTRLQVGSSGTTALLSSSNEVSSPLTVTKKLWATAGLRGFYRGLGPRIMYMSTWGTVLSSFYELLRHVSQKEAS